ncbi:hypothetical protein EDD85DRAFT_797559 [Armillaria nabsnona]|nr:hypothetical protein EDD85DRAFT_797559 [Armillaria nabsnona]
MQSVNPGAKSWNFPKVHSHQHMVNNILEKGVMLNYNMKPNEKMHGPLKDAYQMRTNFKDVAEQGFIILILWVDSWCNTASFIWQQIDLHDEQISQNDNDNDNKELEDQDMQSRLLKFMVGQFTKYPDIIPEVDRQKVMFKSFEPHDEIQLHGLLKVNYKNKVDWTTSTDYLRCSPNFYNHPQYDYLLVDSTKCPFFTQLIMVFTCIIGGKEFPLALVHPFDQPIDAATEKLDKDLGFYRVCT